jgi:hypothetical protein
MTDSPTRKDQFTARTRFFSWIVLLVSLGILCAEAWGLATGGLFSQEIWYPDGLWRLIKYTGLYLAWATPVLILAPWALAALVAGLGAFFTGIAVGPLALLASAYLLISACALGSRIMCRTQGRTAERCSLELNRQTREQTRETHLLATLLGMGVYIFLMPFLARLPVNYPWFYAGLLAVPVVLDPGGCWRRALNWLNLLRSVQLRSWGERAAFVLLVYILVMHWFVILKPESSADALSMHLAVPANIAAHHVMTFEPSRFVWAAMPMGAEFSYAMVYLLGGEFAARLLNFAMLLVLEALLFCAVRRSVPRPAAFLLVALFAASPMVQLVTGSLFVENLLAAMVLGAMTAIWRFGEAGEKKFLYVAAALGGSAMAIKAGALVFAAFALLFATVEARRHWKSLGPRPAASCALAGALFLVAALPPYAIAYWKTGNPLFPFLNQRFHSRLLDSKVEIRDARFRQPLTWGTPYGITFHTNQWYEGQDGSFGFQYLMFAPLALLALLVVRQRPAVSSAVVALGASVVILESEPNARYLYAALPLLSIPFAAVLGWTLSHQRRLYRALLLYILLCTALNAWFLPASSYYHKDFYLRAPLSRLAREQSVGHTAPVRDAIAYFNRAHPGSAVLFTADSFVAGLTGEVYENHWHQANVMEQIRGARDLKELRRLLEGWKVQYFIARIPAAHQYIRPPLLRELLFRCSQPERQFEGFYVARLRADCDAPAPPRVLVVRSGAYDDFDPSIQFSGDWIQDDEFSGPYRHTVSYAEDAGAEASLVFEGTSLTYVFTKAPNRGLAEIVIDGIGRGAADLYSPDVQWQSRLQFAGLGSGRHVVVVRVLGQKQPASQGRFVDLDAFEIR